MFNQDNYCLITVFFQYNVVSSLDYSSSVKEETI